MLDGCGVVLVLQAAANREWDRGSV